MFLNALIPNFNQLSEKILTGSLPALNDIVALRQHGLDALISLLPESEADTDLERTAAEAVGIDFQHIPVDGPEGLNRQAVQALNEYLLANPQKRVLIYCASGNRCGALLALRAAWHAQASTDEALSLGRQAGMKSLEPHVSKLISS